MRSLQPRVLVTTMSVSQACSTFAWLTLTVLDLCAMLRSSGSLRAWDPSISCPSKFSAQRLLWSCCFLTDYRHVSMRPLATRDRSVLLATTMAFPLLPSHVVPAPGLLCPSARFGHLPGTRRPRPPPKTRRCVETGGSMKAPKGKRSPKPMDWAAETRLTRWRRRAAAIALAVIVLLGVVGGAVSNARAGALQSRLRQQSQIEYVYKMDTPFRKAERFVRAPGAILNHRVSSPSEIPSPWTRRSWVSDTAGILSPGAVKEIDGLAKEVQRGTGAELVVVTVPGVQGAERDRREVKRFATQLFNSWGLGDRYKNNGVLVLVSTGDRRVEVEIGRGLNQVFNREEWLQRMIHSRMTPALRHNRYDQGVTSGVAACCQQLEDTDREVSSPQGWRKTATLLWVGSGLAALATPLLLRSWVPAPRCGLCGTRMSRLRPAAAEELLPGQRAELELGSVRHVLCGCGRPGCQKRYAEQGVRSFQGAQRMGGAVGRRGSLRLSPEEVRAATPETWPTNLPSILQLCIGALRGSRYISIVFIVLRSRRHPQQNMTNPPTPLHQLKHVFTVNLYPAPRTARPWGSSPSLCASRVSAAALPAASAPP